MLQSAEVKNMRYPKLVPPAVCRTPIHLVIEQEGYNKYGDPIEAFEADLKCNYQDSGKVQLTTQQEYVRISGKALFDGDICPNVPNITKGYAIIHEEKRYIAEGRKHRNPDGSVNYTEVVFR